MPATPIDLIGGRKPLPQLLAEGLLPYRDQRQAKLFLDRHRIPFVIIRRQRCYRPAAVQEALDRQEQRSLETAA
jgi:hypothetical protein